MLNFKFSKKPLKAKLPLVKAAIFQLWSCICVARRGIEPLFPG